MCKGISGYGSHIPRKLSFKLLAGVLQRNKTSHIGILVRFRVWGFVVGFRLRGFRVKVFVSRLKRSRAYVFGVEGFRI